jgi:hypothetical protein
MGDEGDITEYITGLEDEDMPGLEDIVNLVEEEESSEEYDTSISESAASDSVQVK